MIFIETGRTRGTTQFALSCHSRSNKRYALTRQSRNGLLNIVSPVRLRSDVHSAAFTCSHQPQALWKRSADAVFVIAFLFDCRHHITNIPIRQVIFFQSNDKQYTKIAVYISVFFLFFILHKAYRRLTAGMLSDKLFSKCSDEATSRPTSFRESAAGASRQQVTVMVSLPSRVFEKSVKGSGAPRYHGERSDRTG